MKANELVKEKGISYATKLLNYDVSLAEDKCELDFGECAELKRLVESHELVKDYYGLTKAKEHAESNYTAPELKAALKQAIADVESCQ